MKKVISSCMAIAIIIFLFFFMAQRYHIIDAGSFFSININYEEKRKEYVSSLKEALVLGKPSLELYYYGNDDDIEQFVTGAVDEAFSIDDASTTDDFDYLKYKYKGMHVNMRGFGVKYKVTYRFDYLEDMMQTALVNKEAKAVLKKLSLEKKTEFEKIKAIHDYIISNCDYDMSTKENTAYACLIQGISACQGYAALTYKLMVEAGIECRIVSGKGLTEPHAWNIVKCDGVWYNIDCTWDDPVGAVDDYVGYDYFMKSNGDFSDHTRDVEYDTDEFNKRHVMAKESYDD